MLFPCIGQYKSTSHPHQLKNKKKRDVMMRRRKDAREDIKRSLPLLTMTHIYFSFSLYLSLSSLPLPPSSPLLLSPLTFGRSFGSTPGGPPSCCPNPPCPQSSGSACTTPTRSRTPSPPLSWPQRRRCCVWKGKRDRSIPRGRYRNAGLSVHRCRRIGVAVAPE